MLMSPKPFGSVARNGLARTSEKYVDVKKMGAGFYSSSSHLGPALTTPVLTSLLCSSHIVFGISCIGQGFRILWNLISCMLLRITKVSFGVGGLYPVQ